MKILMKTLSGHNLKGELWNQPIFDVRMFLDRVNVCAKFDENRKGSRFFFVDLAWNDPYTICYFSIPPRTNCYSYFILWV